MKNFFVSHKHPLATMVAIVIMGGLFAYSRLQTSLFPEITFPKIKIIADNGLQPIDKMMVTVTRPLEAAIKRVPDLEAVRSTTSRGECEISAFMDWSGDIDLAQQRIESRINEIKDQLPPETGITVEKMNPSIMPVMGYTIESHDKSPIELKQIANFTIRPYLSQVPGVSEVRVTGGKTKEYWLVLDQQKMSTLSITPDQLNTVLGQTGFLKSNGFLSDYRYLYLTLTDASVYTREDIGNLVIRNTGKRVILLRDIATVKVEEAVEFTRINANGRDGVLIAVMKQPNANLVTLSAAMQARVAGLRNILPKDVSIQPYYIQADFVSTAIRSVTDSLWIGLVLAILVALVFLRSLKAGATILITIPVTLCVTLIFLYAIGYTLNIMTLGAIAAAIGLIIDDAIVVVEQIHRTHEEHPGEPTSALVHKAVRYLFPAMVGSSISTIVIFVPFIWMGGMAGAYFRVMTNTMIIILACSFFVTWILLPVIYLVLSRPRKSRIQTATGTSAPMSGSTPTPPTPGSASPAAGSAPHPHTVKRQRWVGLFIRRPWISLFIIAALVATIVIVLPLLRSGFLPDMDEGSIVLDYKSPPGTSLEETDRMLREVEKLLVKVPEVEAYSRRTGTELGFFVTEPNKGDYLIQLKKKRTRSTDEVIADIRNRIRSTQPALQIDMGQVIRDIIGDLGTSVDPIEIKVFGNDQQKLETLSKQIADIVDSVKGAADVQNGIVIAGPSISVEPNYARLAQFGLTPANLQYQLQAALEGNIVGTLREKEQLINIRMVYPDSRHLTVDGISRLRIFLPNGQLRPITDLATVTIKTGDAEIKRENLQSVGIITARQENRDLGGVMHDIQHAIGAKLVLPAAFHIEYGGDYALQQESFHELLLILIAASLLVFGVILFLFRQIGVALLILGVAVLGISGSYLALYLTNTPLNVGSYTGLIMIVGIIGENAIFTYLQFRDTLASTNVDEAVVYAISTRLRPKLMTALGAIIALLPLALGIGAGAQLHQPLAIAVIGGFVIALPLLLIVLPTMLRLLFIRHRTTLHSV